MLEGAELDPLGQQIRDYEESIADRLGDAPPVPIVGYGTLEEKFRYGQELGFGTSRSTRPSSSSSTRWTSSSTSNSEAVDSGPGGGPPAGLRACFSQEPENQREHGNRIDRHGRGRVEKRPAGDAPGQAGRAARCRPPPEGGSEPPGDCRRVRVPRAVADRVSGLTVGPMIFSLYLAFTKATLTDPSGVGLDNFVRMFTEDPNYIQSVQITLVYVLVGTPIKLAAALGIAMLLNYRDRGSGFFRSSFYAPSLIGASVSVAIVWRAMFSNDGPVDNSLSFFGIDIGGWVGNVQLVIPMMIRAGGVAVRRPDGDLPRGPEADPAGALRGRRGRRRRLVHKFRNVTIPMLSSVIFFNLLLEIINAFQVFASAYIDQRLWRPAGMTNFYTCTAARFADLQMGYASAMAWVLVIAVAIIAFIRSRPNGSTTPERTDDHFRSRGRRERSSNRLPSPAAAQAVARANTVIWFVALLVLVAIVLYPLLYVPLHVHVERVRAEPRPDPREPHRRQLRQGRRGHRRNPAVAVPRTVLHRDHGVIGTRSRTTPPTRSPASGSRVGILFAAMIGTLLLPFHVIIIPQYIMFNKLELVDTYWPLILPKFLATEAFFVFLIVQFIRNIPRDMDEAARIDGAGHIRIFFSIILPLIGPP